MSDKSNDLPDEYTGITSVIGGNNYWSCYGGSRLMLGDDKGYVKFDCTNDVNINFKTNLSDHDCGLVFAMYMVAMESINNDYSGTLYNDAQGIGLVSGPESSNTLNSRTARSEIDLLETSGRSAQTTLHGYGNGKTASRWQNNIDMDGIWNNSNVDSTGSFRETQPLGKQNDIGSKGINTNKPISVFCNIKPTLITKPDIIKNIKNLNNYLSEQTKFYTLELTTHITQDDNVVTLSVDSANPSPVSTIKTYFPEYELQNMVLCYSLWTDVNKTQWLDGTPSPTASFGPQRGPCNDTDYNSMVNMQQKINQDPGSKKGSYLPCYDENFYYNNLYDLNFSITNGAKISKKKDKIYNWILDYQYRGINDKPASPQGRVQYNANKLTSWSGRYNYSYLNCQNDPDSLALTITNKKIPNNISNTNPYPPGQNGTPTMFTSACNSIFSGTKSQYNSSSFPPNCSYSSGEPCQVIKTNLADYKAYPQSPNYSCVEGSCIETDNPDDFKSKNSCLEHCRSPPSPPPSPSPTPPSPTPPSPSSKDSKSNNKVLPIISIGLSILVILLVIYFMFM